ncbi:MAG: LTA synthase family protein [Bifidobacterium sp.]|nr:LTA synthase family protein [Bifidobacterium sp.]
MVFVLVTVAATLAIQASVYVEPTYDAGAQVDAATRAAQSVRGQLTGFVTQAWLMQSYQFVLNILIIGAIYSLLVVIINRFWSATAVFGIVAAVFAIAGNYKIQLRNEPILLADFNFLAGGNTGELLSFLPAEEIHHVKALALRLVVFAIACGMLQILDKRRSFIPTYWRRPLAGIGHIAGNLTRLTAIICSVVFLFSFTWNLSLPNSWSTRWAASLGDKPQLWNGWGDAAANGPMMTLLRLAHTKIMDRPTDYSESTMRAIAKRYASDAKTINATRDASLTDSTLIVLLSESFSDPTRVPGVSFNEDPMPQIRAIKNSTTSGYMLSPGYGGGTANIEYQALTGLSMANYSSSLSVAYQQLVPKERWTPTFNQLWNSRYGAQGSQAIHTYMNNMYFRNSNYKKFGFYKFWALNGPDKITGCTKIDRSWYVSDQCTYDNVIQRLSNSTVDNQFLQVVTMQNHLPYNDWYDNNQFKADDTSSNLTGTERANVETYAKGVHYTDQATADFLNQLNKLNRPVTLVFYGDHLPGIYPSAYANKDNVLGLHETDYFIWSNAASASHTTKLPDDTSQYTSSNYFLAQTAQHMNAKVSPYLAFLSAMHEQIPALSVPASSGNSHEKPVYLDATGREIDTTSMSAQARSMLHDYQLIQYDISTGKNYLKDTDFMRLP